MRLALAAVALMVAMGASVAAPSDRMAGWYLAMVTPAGHPTINNSPFGSEALCERQLADMRALVPDLLGECVDLEPHR